MFDMFSMPMGSFPMGVAPGAGSNLFLADLASYLAGAGFRAYPQHVPTAVALPAVTYSRPYSDRAHHLGGASGVATDRIRFTAYALTYRQAKTTAEALRRLLQTYTGLMGTTTLLETNLHNREGGYEPTPSASDRGTFSLATEYTIAYRESIPYL